MMKPIRLQITDAIVAACTAVPGAVGRYLQDELGDENTESEGLLCVVVMGTDAAIGETNRPITRELSGHIVIESVSSAIGQDSLPVVNAAEREAWHDKVAQVESAVLALTDTIAVPGVIYFRVQSVDFTFDGELAGRLAARIDWLCSYRHSATDSRVA